MAGAGPWRSCFSQVIWSISADGFHRPRGTLNGPPAANGYVWPSHWPGAATVGEEIRNLEHDGAYMRICMIPAGTRAVNSWLEIAGVPRPTTLNPAEGPLGSEAPGSEPVSPHLRRILRWADIYQSEKWHMWKLRRDLPFQHSSPLMHR